MQPFVVRSHRGHNRVSGFSSSPLPAWPISSSGMSERPVGRPSRSTIAAGSALRTCSHESRCWGSMRPSRTAAMTSCSCCRCLLGCVPFGGGGGVAERVELGGGHVHDVRVRLGMRRGRHRLPRRRADVVGGGWWWWWCRRRRFVGGLPRLRTPRRTPLPSRGRGVAPRGYRAGSGRHRRGRTRSSGTTGRDGGVELRGGALVADALGDLGSGGVAGDALLAGGDRGPL